MQRQLSMNRHSSCLPCNALGIAVIREDQLATVIARAHGFARTGRLIRERVAKISRASFNHLKDQQGLVFVWADEDQPRTLRQFRVPNGQEADRSIDLIALPELVLAANALGASEDPAVAVARRFQISRLRRDARKRIELALGSDGAHPPSA